MKERILPSWMSVQGFCMANLMTQYICSNQKVTVMVLDRVYKLKRSLYGLKQASLCWNKHFRTFLSEVGFKTSEADPCLYIRDKDDKKFDSSFVCG
ncbi:hypothetical protein AVEN_173961-1 [Araneus ventricosus]|uniref:Reverse transcriptase Ty1/copia-type domain-containing protein n=1 Tax=Araneus ventricosus TaxID=182803 RepID=A0A4Y2KEE9_ARAVE|nr:hypothetical protein AVEN_173961-1 [Araneus ventricosus]